MSSKTDLARRLELAQVEDVGEFVTGRARGMVVTLEGEAPFSTCVVELGSAIPIARMVMRPGDLNHPDAVETGDAEFDEVMQVTALASYAPTLQQLLSDKPLRLALVEFLKRNPSAEFNGSRLRVPAGEGGVTQQLVVDALTIADAVAQRFASIGFLESEAPAKIAPDEQARRLRKRLGFAAFGSSAFYLSLALISGAEPSVYWLGGGLFLVAVSLFSVLLTQDMVDESVDQ